MRVHVCASGRVPEICIVSTLSHIINILDRPSARASQMLVSTCTMISICLTLPSARGRVSPRPTHRRRARRTRRWPLIARAASFTFSVRTKNKHFAARLKKQAISILCLLKCIITRHAPVCVYLRSSRRRVFEPHAIAVQALPRPVGLSPRHQHVAFDRAARRERVRIEREGRSIGVGIVIVRRRRRCVAVGTIGSSHDCAQTQTGAVWRLHGRRARDSLSQWYSTRLTQRFI